MQTVVGYHRPENLDEALTLLNREGLRSVILAGGTFVNAEESSDPVEMIDLQNLGLDTVRLEGSSVEVGAMVRLTDFLTHESVPAVLQEVATREGPNTFRNMGTIGGTVAKGHPDSELLAGLLAYGTRVTLARMGGATQSVQLEELLADRRSMGGAIITKIAVDIDRQAAVARTGRTPADTSIVAVVGCLAPEGMRLGITGVADTPVLTNPSRIDGLEPQGDFRGSSEYRRHLAGTLARRVLGQLGEQP
jgi:CO/xanthine dehydrogenase FAD-binding subunit